MECANFQLFLLFLSCCSFLCVSGDIQQCLVDYAQKVQGLSNPNKEHVCPPLKKMMSCMLRATGVPPSSYTTEMKAQMQNQLDTQMQQHDLNCDFNVDDILRESDGPAPQGGNKEPTGMAKCLSVYMTAASGATSKDDPMICDAAEEMTKCTFKVMQVDVKNLNATTKQQVEDQANKGYQSQGINCELDIDRIINSMNGGPVQGRNKEPTGSAPQGGNKGNTVGDGGSNSGFSLKPLSLIWAVAAFVFLL